MNSIQERTIPGYELFDIVNKNDLEVVKPGDDNYRETIATFYAEIKNKPIVILPSKTKPGQDCVYVGISKEAKWPIIADRLTFTKPSLYTKFLHSLRNF